MNDRLIEILKQTDIEDGGRARRDGQASLLDGAMVEAASRLRRRKSIAGACAAVAVVSLLFGGQHLLKLNSTVPDRIADRASAPNGTERPAASAEGLRRELEALDREAAVATAFLEQYASRRRTRQLNARLSRTTTSTVNVGALIEAESAAQTMLIRGDRLAGDKLTQRLAPETYRRVIELFPDSSAATDARRRLESGPKGERA